MAKLAKRPAKAHRKYTWGNFFIGLFILAFSLVCLLPMVLTVIVSFTDERAIMRNGYSFFPEQFSTYAYELMFNRGSSVIQGYLVSIFVTVVGTLSAVLITGLAAYTLANKNVKYRNVLGMYFFIPMVFGAGIVPWYLMCTALNLRNNIFALLIPNLLFNTFNLFLVRNFMSGLPDELRESATIDGANDAVIAFRIYFPLSVPGLATVALFYGLAYWNDWTNAQYYISDSRMLSVQALLNRMVQDIQALLANSSANSGSLMQTPQVSIRMAIAFVAMIPILILYPFLQKYFADGIMLGAVKG